MRAIGHLSFWKTASVLLITAVAGAAFLNLIQNPAALSSSASAGFARTIAPLALGLCVLGFVVLGLRMLIVFGVHGGRRLVVDGDELRVLPWGLRLKLADIVEVAVHEPTALSLGLRDRHTRRRLSVFDLAEPASVVGERLAQVIAPARAGATDA